MPWWSRDSSCALKWAPRTTSADAEERQPLGQFHVWYQWCFASLGYRYLWEFILQQTCSEFNGNFCIVAFDSIFLSVRIVTKTKHYIEHTILNINRTFATFHSCVYLFVCVCHCICTSLNEYVVFAYFPHKFIFAGPVCIFLFFYTFPRPFQNFHALKKIKIDNQCTNYSSSNYCHLIFYNSEIHRFSHHFYSVEMKFCDGWLCRVKIRDRAFFGSFPHGLLFIRQIRNWVHFHSFPPGLLFIQQQCGAYQPTIHWFYRKRLTQAMHWYTGILKKIKESLFSWSK